MYDEVHFEIGAFQMACSKGDYERVVDMLSLTGDAYLPVGNEKSFGFVEACRNGHIRIVQRLLDEPDPRRFDVHIENDLALRVACNGNHVEVVKLLLGLKGDRQMDVHLYRDDAFDTAVHRGSEEMVRAFLALEGRRRIHSERSVMTALSWGPKDVCLEVWTKQLGAGVVAGAADTLVVRLSCALRKLAKQERRLRITAILLRLQQKEHKLSEALWAALEEEGL